MYQGRIGVLTSATSSTVRVRFGQVSGHSIPFSVCDLDWVEQESSVAQPKKMGAPGGKKTSTTAPSQKQILIPSMEPVMMQSLESAAFAAWPSGVSINLNGWHLRLDRGYTKRANSLNATEHSQSLSAAEIDSIEARFSQLGLPTTIRLTSFFSSVADTDTLLEQRGYRHCDLSMVMTRALSDADGLNQEVETLEEGAERWLEAFQLVSEKSGADQTVHLEILRRIAHPTAWAAHHIAGSPQCCGLGVLVDQNFGLFDIATSVDYQRQGLAQQLCQGLLAWGRHQGAHTAFLQVVATNGPAIKLYEKLGFQVTYSYWYRVRQD